MSRYFTGLIWIVIGGVSATIIWVTLPWNTVFALGMIAGVSLGGLQTVSNHLSGVTVSTAVVTLSTGTIVATLSIATVSTVWLPVISTATLGYAIGIVATWLLVSGVSVDEIGSFAAIGGLVVAVVGGAAGLLFVDDRTLFLALLFAGLAAGLVVPLSGLLHGLLRTTPGSRRSTDDETITPATRFGIEAAVIAGAAVAVPFGSRAVALFGYGSLEAFPVGVGCGALLSVGIPVVGGGHSDRLERLRNRLVEGVYRLADRINNWIERRRKRSQHSEEASIDDGDSGGETTAAGGEESFKKATSLVDGIADRIADHGLVIEAAEEIDSFVKTNNGLQNRIDRFWGRLGGAVARSSLTSGAALQLSAASEADSEGDPERAQSRTDAALELAAPTIGAVAAAVVRGREDRKSVLDGLAPLFARIETLLNEKGLSDDPDDPEGFRLIQQLLERLVDEDDTEGFDTALSTIRAAAADGWYSVQAGDQALESGDYQRALTAYLAAIEAYRRAYDIATDAQKTAAAERRDDEISDTGRTVTASASTYASEATRIATALEAILHNAAAVTAAAVDDLYGDDPPPTVDTDARRTIVRCLRTFRETRSRIDATVPPVDLADDRYQRAEIARSLARLRRHLQSADETAHSGNVEAATEQYERVADRLDVLSNRAGTAGLADLAQSLVSTAAAVGHLAEEPTAEAIQNRPDLTAPSTDDLRLPEVAPVGRRLRRSFCEPAFLDLWEFTVDAGDHSVLDIAGEPYPELVGSVGMALSGLDPLYTGPDVDSLHDWVAEVSLDALSTAVETVSKHHSTLAATEPSPPPAFREPPEILQTESVAAVPTAQGIETFCETWLSRATAVVEAKNTIDRQQAAVDGFAALEPRIRKTLQADGSLDSSQVSAELLVVAAHHLSGVEYDFEAERLSKTGAISRRSIDETVDEAATDEK